MASTMSSNRELLSVCNNCDRLWRVWYCALVVVIHVYLLFAAVQQRYLPFKQQAYDPRFGGQWSEVPMNVYLGMIVLSAAMLPLFIYASLFKVGNPANDSVPFGRDTDEMSQHTLQLMPSASINGGLGNTNSKDGSRSVDELTGTISQRPNKPPSQVVWARICRHFLPYNCCLHLVSAFALLLPLPILQAEQVRNEALPQSKAWSSDLDFLLPRWEWFSSSATSTAHRTAVQDYSVSLEMMNYALALAFLTVRFPNLFWHTSRLFTLLFSIIVFATSVQLLFEVAVVSVVVKLVFSGLLDEFAYEPLLNPWLCICLAALSFLLSLLACVLVYEYGHGQFLKGVESYQQCFVPSVVSFSAGGSVMSQGGSGGHCDTSWPCVSILLVNLLMVGVRVPLMSQFLHLWKHLPSHKSTSLPLTAFVITVITMVLWFLLWFAFAIKTQWDFLINVPMPRMPSTSDSKQPLLSPAEPVYGCFPDTVAPSHSSNSSTNAEAAQHGGLMMNTRLHMDCYSESSRASSTNPRLANYILTPSGVAASGSGNYVTYVHNPNMPMGISTISEHVDMPNKVGGAFMKTSTSQGSLRADTQYATLASLRAAATVEGNPLNLPIAHPFITSQGSDLDSSGDLLDGGGSGGGGSDLLPRSNKLRSGSASGLPANSARNRVTFKDGGGNPPPEEYEDYRVFRTMFNGSNTNNNNPQAMVNYPDMYGAMNKLPPDMMVGHHGHHPMSSSSASGANSSTMENMAGGVSHMVPSNNSAATSPSEDMLDDRLCSQV